MNGGDTFFAFMTGLALGAVAALLSNPDHRRKLKNTFQDVSDKGQKMLAETTKKAEKLSEEVGDRAQDLSRAVSDKAEELAKTAEERAQEVRKEVVKRTPNKSNS